VEGLPRAGNFHPDNSPLLLDGERRQLFGKTGVVRIGGVHGHQDQVGARFSGREPRLELPSLKLLPSDRIDLWQLHDIGIDPSRVRSLVLVARSVSVRRRFMTFVGVPLAPAPRAAINQ
jgi:hypothetical protein